MRRGVAGGDESVHRSPRWRCKVCTLWNSAPLRICVACGANKGKATRGRAAAEPRVAPRENRAYWAGEPLKILFKNPHQHPSDVISIVHVDAVTASDRWPVPGLTDQHWTYVGGAAAADWSACLQKAPPKGTVAFPKNTFKPGCYQAQLRYYSNGSWSNVRARCRVDITTTAAHARRLPPSDALPLLPAGKGTSTAFPPKKRHRAVVGLQNVGNTCYMNASVQCLVSMSPVLEAFQRRAPGPVPPASTDSLLDINRKNFGKDRASLPLDSPKSSPGKLKKKARGGVLAWGRRGRGRRASLPSSPARVVPSRDRYGATDTIRISFRDPASKPYSVVVLLPELTHATNGDSWATIREGVWPVPGADVAGMHWFYTDGSSDCGVSGCDDGTINFSARDVGGGVFFAQLRRYKNGSWKTVAAEVKIKISGPPVCHAHLRRPRRRKQTAAAGPNVTSSSGRKIKFEKVKLEKGASTPPESRSPQRRPLKPGVLADEFTRIVHTLSDYRYEQDGSGSAADESQDSLSNSDSVDKGDSSEQDMDGSVASSSSGGYGSSSSNVSRSAGSGTRGSGSVSGDSPSNPGILGFKTQYVCPDYMKRLIEYVRPEFRGTRQHDCQEFTQALIDELNRDLVRENRKTARGASDNAMHSGGSRKRRRPGAATTSVDERARDMWLRLQAPTGGSVISQLCFGMLEDSVTCSLCDHKSTTFSTFSTVSLNVPTRNPPVRRPRARRGRHSAPQPTHTAEARTLADCFDAFTREERLHGANAYLCSRCKKRGDAIKRMRFYHLPPVLIIHLQRFACDGLGQKAEAEVAFPNEIDLSKYCLRSAQNYNAPEKRDADGSPGIGPSPGTQDCRYRLVGVVNHMQRDGYKHYTAVTQARLAEETAASGGGYTASSARRGVGSSSLAPPRQPDFGYVDDRAGWVEFDDEKAWQLSSNAARSERATGRARKEAYLLFYESVAPSNGEPSATGSEPENKRAKC